MNEPAVAAINRTAPVYEVRLGHDGLDWVVVCRSCDRWSYIDAPRDAERVWTEHAAGQDGAGCDGAAAAEGTAGRRTRWPHPPAPPRSRP